MQYYWKIKSFKSKEAMTDWLEEHSPHIQWHEVFVNNGHAIEYRHLRVI